YQVDGVDEELGMGKFIYLQASEAIATGKAVTFGITNVPGDSAWLLVTGSKGPVAVAVADLAGEQFGWFQVYGVTSVLTDGEVSAIDRVGATDTGGVVEASAGS